MAKRSKGRRKARRAAIVLEAARKLKCTVRDIFVRAAKGTREVLVVNLKKVPEYVFMFALEVLGLRFQMPPRPAFRQRYRRATPALTMH